MMPKEMQPNEVPQQETINVRGQKREYHFVETVKSMEELETFRFKNFCVFNGIISNRRVRNAAKSFIMPCSRKKYGKRCDFELRAVRPSLESGTIHVYAHSQHNHPILPEERRAIIRREKELMPDANPPAIFRTPDNIDWQFLQTLPDYEKMQKFRSENHGHGNARAFGDKSCWRIRFVCKSRNQQNQCKFMLLAMKTTTNGYHVYKHGEHNLHHFMPADNPPSTFKTQDNLEWTFLQTFADFDKMDEFRRTNHTYTRRWREKSWQKIRLYCHRHRHRSSDNCQFMLLAMKTTKQEYHVYKHGEHEHSNHPAPNWKPQPFHDNEQNVDQQEQMMGDKENKNDEDEENETMEQGEEEEGYVKDGGDDEGIEVVLIEKEQEKEEDQDDENGDEEEQQQVRQHQPPSSITKKIMSQEREYRFVTTVKSVEELDKIRFENYCNFWRGKPLQILKPLIMPCTRKHFGQTCNFQLMAMPTTTNGDIHVYAYSQHNDHPFLSDEKRTSIRKGKELMPHENPPNVFVTPDNIEWQFLQTFSDYEKVQQFRCENQCKSRACDEMRNGIRSFCMRRRSQNCKFMLLTMKTIKQGYHVYKHGQHKHNNNHHALKSKKRQQPARKRQKRDEEMETEDEEDYDDEEEEEEKDYDDEEEEEEEEEDYDDEEDEMEEKDKDKDGLLIEKEDEERFAEEDEEESVEEEKEEEQIKKELEGEGEEKKEESDDEEEDEDEDDEEELLIKEEVEEEVEEEDKEPGQGSVKMEIKEENPFDNPAGETLEEKLAKANEKVYKWMAGIEPNEIGQTIGEWDKLSLLKMVEMADQEIRKHPQNLYLWLPWLKCAIPKCSPQIDGFNMRFKDLIKSTFN